MYSHEVMTLKNNSVFISLAIKLRMYTEFLIWYHTHIEPSHFQSTSYFERKFSINWFMLLNKAHRYRDDGKLHRTIICKNCIRYFLGLCLGYFSTKEHMWSNFLVIASDTSTAVVKKISIRTRPKGKQSIYTP